jgi:putative tryptophan/tyrosine transport system substrate-binding protein
LLWCTTGVACEYDNLSLPELPGKSGAHEAAEIHYTSRQRSGVAARSTRAAADAGNRVPQGLADTLYTEGQNLTIEYRWAEDRYDRLPALAAELVQRRVAVIVAPGSVVAASAAKAATTVIPIVFMVGSDPIEAGLVTSLNHPGSNLSGIAYLNVEVATKRLELLHKAIPAATSVALLVNPANTVEAEIQTKELQAATDAVGVRLRVLHATNLGETEEAFATIGRDRAGALQLGVDPLFAHVRDVIAMAARHSVPTIYPWSEFTAAGGLMSYGALILDASRQVGVYTGKILNGEKVANLPVPRPTKLEFVINLKTATALGLTMSPVLLAIADKVIE